MTQGPPDGDGGGWHVTPGDRAALLRKYQALSAWRRARDKRSDQVGAEAAPTDPRALRTLSQEFPGALRELDVLGHPEILRRIEYLARRVPHDGIAELWLPWILAYHALMRAVLVAKRAYGRSRRVSETAMAEIIRAASAAAGLPIGEPFLRTVARPPGGRLAVVVLGDMAHRFGVPATRISTTLFPPRRPAPYLPPG